MDKTTQDQLTSMNIMKHRRLIYGLKSIQSQIKTWDQSENDSTIETVLFIEQKITEMKQLVIETDLLARIIKQ